MDSQTSDSGPSSPVAGPSAVETPRASRLGAAALLLASSTLLSRILGYAREALLAYRVGAGAATDAYYAAFQIPDLLNYLLAGGALSIAFIPLYARHLSGDDTDGAERFFATVLGTLGALALLSTALLWWFAEPLVALQFPRFDAPTQQLTVHLTRIVLPAQVFFIAGGIINGALLARGRFGPSAAAPLLYNGGIILGGLLLAPHLGSGVEGFSWGALAGAFLGPFLAPILDARGRVRIRARVALFDGPFLRYLAVAAPLMLGQTLLTVDEWYGRWFGALLGTGTVSHLSYARRLTLVPVAVIGQAIAAAALPTLAHLWAERRTGDLNRVVLRTLRTGLVLAVFGASALAVMARDLVVVVYQHGAFHAADTAVVAPVLSVLALAVPAWIVQQIAARAFYARGDTWRPMLLGTAIAVAAIPLYLTCGRHFGIFGLAAAGVIGMTVNASATLALARWLHGAPDLRQLFATALRAAAIAAAAGVITHLVVVAMRAPSTAGALVTLAAGSVVFLIVTIVGVAVAGDDALRDTLRRLRGRSAPRGPAVG